MPTSELISSLRPIPASIKHINIVGTDPSFFVYLGTKKEDVKQVSSTSPFWYLISQRRW